MLLMILFLKRQSLSLFVVIFVLALSLASCATERGPSGRFPVSSLDGIHGVIALRVKPYTANIDIDEPIKGSGAGALMGAGGAAGAWGVGTAGALSNPYTAIVFVALLPVVAVTGAITGGIMAHPEKEVIEATTAIKEVLTAAKPAKGIQEAIEKSLIDLNGGRVKVHALSESEINMPPAQLAGLGIDAVLDIEISHLDLIVFGDFDPDASLTMAIRSNIIVTDTGTVSASSSYTYLGKRHDYFELAEDDAYLLRESINQSYKEIAELLVIDCIK